MSDTITAAKFVDILKGGEQCNMLDVRTAPERREVRIQADCLHMPLDKLEVDTLRRVVSSSNKPLYVLCRSGNRARQAADILRKSGIDRAVVVDGGIDACIGCGVDVLRDDVISLERQVRMLAGSLVLLGLLLGAFYAPAFYILSAFIGCGLVFSGITGWCGGALLLAKAPWNR